jgi:hypothetical protein
MAARLIKSNCFFLRQLSIKVFKRLFNGILLFPFLPLADIWKSGPGIRGTEFTFCRKKNCRLQLCLWGGAK